MQWCHLHHTQTSYLRWEQKKGRFVQLQKLQYGR